MKFASAIALAAISGASAFVAPQGPAASTTQLSMSDVRTSVRCVTCWVWIGVEKFPRTSRLPPSRQ